ncbi:MAG: 2-oxoacid:acceptor oxidoreductase family protein [Thermoplasmata archaeon]|jgi:2-oxoglutarate ferredoxin oxidoreductase subunit gamma
MIQIKIGGWAGQGVVLSGVILSTAFSNVLNKNVVMTRSYTAAVRSGITSADIIVDDNEIYDLNANEPNVLIIMYQKTFDKYIEMVKRAEYVIIDSTLVTKVPEDLKNVYNINASEIAAKISSPKIANMVLLGKYAAITKHLPLESLLEALKYNVSKKFLEEDIKAMNAGYYS